MRIVASVSTKGGVGKSTLTACLAMEAVRQGHSVYIVDLDPQQSTAAWWRRADSPDNPMLVTGVDKVSIAAQIIKEKGAERDYLFVDTPGSMMNVIANAMERADALAVVVQPSPKDIESQGAVEGLMLKLGKTDRSLYVLNRCDRRTSLPVEAIEAISKKSLRQPSAVGNRTAYIRADAQGLTGPALDSAAAEEITELWAALKEIADASEKDKFPLRPIKRTTGHDTGASALGEGSSRLSGRQDNPQNGENRFNYVEDHSA